MRTRGWGATTTVPPSSLTRAAAAEPIGYNTRHVTGPTFSYDPATYRTPYLRLNSKDTGLARGITAGDQLG